MDHDIIYIGCFLDYDSLRSKIEPLHLKHLDRIITNPHVTFEYRPKQIDRTLFGKKVGITAVGYGNNGQNEGLKVVVHSENPAILELYKKIEVPHITLSIGSESRSSATKRIPFADIEPIMLEGTFGGFNSCGEIELNP